MNSTKLFNSAGYQDALNAVLDYLWIDEMHNYADNPSSDHIFCHMAVLRQLVTEENRTCLTDDCECEE